MAEREREEERDEERERERETCPACIPKWEADRSVISQL